MFIATELVDESQQKVGLIVKAIVTAFV